jgi:hypothetical protein
LPDAAQPEPASRVEIRRSVRPALASDPSTTVPAIQRARPRHRVARAALLSALAVSGLAAAYLLGRSADAPDMLADTLATPAEQGAALAAGESEAALDTAVPDAPTITAAVEAPRTDQAALVERPARVVPSQPPPRAKPSNRPPATAFGRPADESFDVGY